MSRTESGLRPSRWISAKTARRTAEAAGWWASARAGDRVALAVAPGPDVQHAGVRRQRGGVQQRGQRDGRFVLPERHVPLAPDTGADQGVRAGERLGRVLAAGHYVPAERGRDVPDAGRVEHMNRSLAVPGPGGGGVHVGACAGGDHRAGPLEHPFGQDAGLALARRAQHEPVFLHAGERPLAELSAAQAQRMPVRAAEHTGPPGQGRPRPPAALGGGQPGPLHGQLRHGREAGTGPQPAPGPPAHGPGAVGVQRPAGQVKPPEQGHGHQDGQAIQVQVVKRERGQDRERVAHAWAPFWAARPSSSA